MSELRIGILGAAGIVARVVTTPAAILPRVEATAIAARGLDRATAYANEHGIPTAYGSYEDLLADPRINAIYNPTPNGLHGRWTIAALRAGKHVLCEKPFTANAREARAVALEADASGLVVMEAFHYRYHPLILRLLEILGSGEIGAIRSVDLTFVGPRPPAGNIRWDWQLAGGALMDMGSYAVHLVRTVLGSEPKVVSASAQTVFPEIDGSFELDLAFGDVPAHISTSMVADALHGEATIVGELGQVTVKSPFTPQRGNELVITTSSGTRRETATLEPTYTFQMSAFVAAVLDGAEVITSADDAVKNMAVIDDAYMAAGMTVRQPTR
jgi:predicted dehydrogenase